MFSRELQTPVSHNSGTELKAELDGRSSHYSDQNVVHVLTSNSSRRLCTSVSVQDPFQQIRFLLIRLQCWS